MYAVSIRTPLAVVFVAALVSAAAAANDDEEASGIGDPIPAACQSWIVQRKGRIQEAFWRLLVELTPLFRTRETTLPKQQESPPEVAPPPHSLTSKAEKKVWIYKKNPNYESEIPNLEPEKEERDLEAVEDYLDAHKEERVPSEDPGQLKPKDPTKDVSPRPEDTEINDDNIFEEVASDYDHRAEDDQKDMFFELEGHNPTVSSTSPSSPSSLPKPIKHLVKIHHPHFKVKKLPNHKSRALPSRRGMVFRRGLAPTKTSGAAQTHSPRGQLKPSRS